MSDTKTELIEKMRSNMSEIQDEQEKTDEEYSRQREIELMQRQLMLGMKLSATYGLF